MTFEIIDKAHLKEYEDFVSTHPKGHFIQSYKWADVKSSWKWQAVAVRNAEGRIVGGASVLIRRMPGVPWTMMYAGRGPVCDVHDREVLAALTEGLKKLGKQNKAYVFKMDPDVCSSDTEFISIMKDLGYSLKIPGKNFEGMQPAYVFRLDVKGKTEEELMASFHQKTRYNIRLSYRKGVEVRVCGEEMLDDFSRIMLETGNRDGFVTRPKEYFATMLRTFGENARLYMAFYEGKPVGGTIAIHYGNKVWYLYGASSNEHRNVMPNYQLQMEMIRWALETGCDIYDFRGVSGDLSPDNPLYGLYLFKKGFMGEFTEFCGEFEIVYKPFVSFMLDKGLSAARNIRRKIVLRGNKA